MSLLILFYLLAFSAPIAITTDHNNPTNGHDSVAEPNVHHAEQHALIADEHGRVGGHGFENSSSAGNGHDGKKEEHGSSGGHGHERMEAFEVSIKKFI